MPDLDDTAIGEQAAKIALAMRDLAARQRLDGITLNILDLADQGVPALIKRIRELETERFKLMEYARRTGQTDDDFRRNDIDPGTKPEPGPLEELQCCLCGRVLTGQDHEETIFTRVRRFERWGNEPVCTVCWASEHPDGRVPVRFLRRKLKEHYEVEE